MILHQWITNTFMVTQMYVVYHGEIVYKFSRHSVESKHNYSYFCIKYSAILGVSNITFWYISSKVQNIKVEISCLKCGFLIELI